jgi:sterol desaturase/sphingolipid hydroxylase (fatty acid hydroxylase superfamily)
LTKKQQVKKKSTWSWEPINPVDNSPLFDWPPSVGKVLTWAKKNYFSISIRMFVILLALATWLIATPALESCREFSLGWITYIYVRNLVLIVIIAGGLHLYLYTFRRQDDKLKFDFRWMIKGNKLFSFRDQVYDNIYWTVVYAVSFWTIFEVLFMWAYANSFLPKISFSSNPIWFIMLLLIIPVWHSMHFYWTHRALHYKPLYDRVHSVHHRNISIGPWSGLSMHPVESFIYLTSIILHLFVASSPFHIVFHLQFLVFNAVIAHSGFEGILFKEKKILDIGRFHHQLHHRFFECNYGNQEMPWDTWFGTFNDGSEDAMVKIRKNRIL